MIIYIFIAIAFTYYFMQKAKIRRINKRENFKIKQEQKFNDLLKNAREQDKAKENEAEINNI